MRYPAAEKLEIIRLVEGSHLPVRRTLARIGVPATILLPLVRPVPGAWPRGSGGPVAPASVYRLLKGHDLVTQPGLRRGEGGGGVQRTNDGAEPALADRLHHLKVMGWGWFYLSTILDDFSRCIVAWKLCTTMRAGDVTDTLELALAASGCGNAKVVHRLRLLSDNGSSYVAGDLADWLAGKGIVHVRGAPNRPQTQGKIERWHQT
jgi:putative transposase